MYGGKQTISGAAPSLMVMLDGASTVCTRKQLARRNLRRVAEIVENGLQ